MSEPVFVPDDYRHVAHNLENYQPPRPRDIPRAVKALHAAADEIVRLRAENERLRSPKASMMYTFDSPRVDCTPVWNAWDEPPKWISTETRTGR